MSASNGFESSILNHILNNADIANIGDATGLRGSTLDGNLYISIHTADPGEGGNQGTNECAYTSYARVAVARDGTKWTISGSAPTQAENAATITFPACTGGSETALYFGIGTDAAGAGTLLLSGALTAPGLAISSGITPRFDAGDLIVTCD